MNSVTISSMRVDPRLSALFDETRTSVPGLTSMLKDEPEQYSDIFSQVFTETVRGEQQALQGLPSQLDLEEATLEFIEGGLVAGSFGGMLRWARRGAEVDTVIDQARELVKTGEAREALQQHQQKAEEALANPQREGLHQSFLEGVWVGALETALHVGA